MRPITGLLFATGLMLASGVRGQEAGEAGDIVVGNVPVHIETVQGRVALRILDPGDGPVQAPSFNRKIEQLTRQISNHLKKAEEQEDLEFSDQQNLYRATSYARKLVEKVSLLVDRISFLGAKPELTRSIEAAAADYDVMEIKRLLSELLVRDGETVAEAAFQLGGFQELDGQYQDAWANYQKASNLHPENQLYMDAHGKNQF